MPEHERRRKLILELIVAQPVGTQDRLVELLRQQGVACTQASVSRDLKELGLIKHGGRYTMPPGTPAPPRDADAGVLQRVRAIESAGDALLVVRTNPGEASLVALAIDDEHWSSVVGTVAGDDTVFVACPGRVEQQKTIRRLRSALAATGDRKGARG